MCQLFRFSIACLVFSWASYISYAQFPVFRSWTNAGGGSYGNPFNWNPSGVPNVSDGASFALDGSYTVTFPSNVATGSAIVSEGSVSFDLGSSGTARTYTLGSLAVGATTGDPFLDIRSGTIAVSTFRVTNGAAVATVLNGLVDVADGSATVTGFGSIWGVLDGVLRVGRVATGTLTISEGGRIQSEDGTEIGRFPGSNGTITVTGDNSDLTVNASLTIGQEGTGTLNIDPGGMVDVAGDIVLFPGGLVRQDGGTLSTSRVTFDGGGQFDFLSGMLHVEEFDGVLINQGGFLSPGQSVGSTTIVGQYVQEPGAALDIEIGGLSAGTEHDLVTVNGNVQLDGGELRLSLLDGFEPNFIHTFAVLDADGEISGQLDNVVNGERLAIADGTGSFLVHYGPLSLFTPNEIVLSGFLPSISGDFDHDGDVDGRDFLVWQRGGSPNRLSASDLALWQSQYGNISPLSITLVPEPSNGVRLCLSALFFSFLRIIRR